MSFLFPGRITDASETQAVRKYGQSEFCVTWTLNGGCGSLHKKEKMYMKRTEDAGGAGGGSVQKNPINSLRSHQSNRPKRRRKRNDCIAAAKPRQSPPVDYSRC